MSSIKRLHDGLFRFTPAADYSGKEGYGVNLAAGICTVSTSATVQVAGIIVEGGTVAQGCTVAILGAVNGAIEFKLSGTVGIGSGLCQSTDGTFIADSADTTARVRVGVAGQAGVTGDRIMAFPKTPVALATAV